MTPLEIAAKAWWDFEIDQAESEKWDDLTEHYKGERIRFMRAALLALAECDPSEDMLIATNALNKTPIKDCASEGMTVFRAILRAIATEGKDV